MTTDQAIKWCRSSLKLSIHVAAEARDKYFGEFSVDRRQERNTTSTVDTSTEPNKNS